MSDSLQREIAYLKSLRAVRERSRKVYDKTKTNALLHFYFDAAKLDEAAAAVADVTRRRFAGDISAIPPHSRWRHLDAGDVPRVQRLLDDWKAKCDTTEMTRRLLDLFVVSVLLDAGAGSAWSYKEPATGNLYTRSEGLGVASIDMFTAGKFSSDTSQPHRVDAAKLLQISVEDVQVAFQSNDSNPLEGLEGRANLLSRLGQSLTNRAEFFKHSDDSSVRPGNLVDYLMSHPSTDNSTKEVQLETLWSVIIDGLAEVWPPTRTMIGGISLGDVWPCETLRSPHALADSPDHLIPFHKLSQWLTYSLMEPLNKVLGVTFANVNLLTGLPEYRNGGLLVDTGVLTLKTADRERGLAFYKENVGELGQPAAEEVPMFEASDSVIVEWRALIVVLLDEVAARVRRSFGVNEKQMTLAQVLEAGTWNAGRELAAKLRPTTRGPPIAIKSDGTVF